MERGRILQEISEVMAQVFDLDDLTLTEATSAKDIEEWDSLSHIRLVVSIEREFNIKFSNSEIESLSDVGDLVDIIQEKVRS